MRKFALLILVGGMIGGCTGELGGKNLETVGVSGVWYDGYSVTAQAWSNHNPSHTIEISFSGIFHDDNGNKAHVRFERSSEYVATQLSSLVSFDGQGSPTAASFRSTFRPTIRIAVKRQHLPKTFVFSTGSPVLFYWSLL